MEDKYDYQKIRKEYNTPGLRKEALSADPIEQFSAWFDEAVDNSCAEPNAMTLATAAGNGKPSVRTVLLKHFDRDGFVFYTNYESRKGRELAENPKASLLFYWGELLRQVRIEGRVEKVSALESDEYFRTRPFKSRISAWASPQSQVIKDRDMLENRFSEIIHQYQDKELPRPSHWGGYRVIPDCLEFWQGRENRLHDRIRYSRIKKGWLKERLAP